MENKYPYLKNKDNGNIIPYDKDIAKFPYMVGCYNMVGSQNIDDISAAEYKAFYGKSKPTKKDVKVEVKETPTTTAQAIATIELWMFNKVVSQQDLATIIANAWADDEDKRLAEEAEAKRLAEEAEAKRLAEEAEAKRLAEEANSTKAKKGKGVSVEEIELP